MGLSLKQIGVLQQRGIFPHRCEHRSHEMTLQGMAWLVHCLQAQRNTGRVMLGEPLLGKVAETSAVDGRDLVVQAIRLLPYPDTVYFQLIAFQGKTPPPFPWCLSPVKKLSARHEIGSVDRIPFTVADGFPSWLLLSQELPLLPQAS